MAKCGRTWVTGICKVTVLFSLYSVWSFIKFRTEKIFHCQEQVKISGLHMFKNLLGKNHRGIQKKYINKLEH